MHADFPDPVSTAEQKSRRDRATRIARRYGFIGTVEYRHAYTGCGGAQYGRGATIARDTILVDARAFQRDCTSDDFSLEAIIAHECGHQVVQRNEVLQGFLPAAFSRVTEEVVASLVASLLVEPRDAECLVLKAIADLVTHGIGLTEASERVHGIVEMLEAVL